MLVGYMRVSSDNDRQTTDLQRDALLEAEVDPSPSTRHKNPATMERR
jgi:DNA invertase Pin-like site-specific DNA recombinase